VLILVTIAVLGGAFALVAWRRRATSRWQPEPVDAAADAGAADATEPWCAPVWVQKVLPRRTMRAGDRVTGELCIDLAARVATFRVPDGQEVVLTRVRTVQVGARGSDFVNTWVEVDCDVGGRRMTIYLNDATWLGWRPLLTGSNARLADALDRMRIRGPGADPS
jgi:hypothetical protein